MLLANFEAIAVVELEDLNLGVVRKDCSQVVVVKKTDFAIN